MLIDSEPGFWERVVVDMILHPHRDPFGWRDVLIIGVILIAVAALHEIPVVIARWLFRSASDAHTKANRPPPEESESSQPPRPDGL
ncbi:MAG: hypothetical protein ABIQ43_05940 [Sphingomonas sp.]